MIGDSEGRGSGRANPQGQALNFGGSLSACLSPLVGGPLLVRKPLKVRV